MNRSRILVVMLVLLVWGGTNVNGQVYLNEVMGSNEWTWKDQFRDAPNWIEIYNAGPEAVDLEGYGLAKSADSDDPWIFPPVEIPADGYLVVAASGRSISNAQPFHTNFSISASGDQIFLLDPTGSVIDQTPHTRFVTDVSLGRYPDGTGPWVQHVVPTPGSANTPSPHERLLSPPTFSHEPGYHGEPFLLHLEHSDPTVEIRYTLDGTKPTVDSSLYTEPISMEERGDDHVYTYIHTGYDGGSFNPRSVAPMGTVVRAAAFAADALPSRTVTRTFFVGFSPHERYGIPVVTLTSEPDDLFGPYGLHVGGRVHEKTVDWWRDMHPTRSWQQHPGNFHQRGRVRIPLAGVSPRQIGSDLVGIPAPSHGVNLRFNFVLDVPHIRIVGTENYDGGYLLNNSTTAHELRFEAPFVEETFPHGAYIIADWERPMHMELFDGEGELLHRQDLGMRIHGSASRVHRQKNFRMYARNAYDDDNAVHAPLMLHGGQDVFRRFIIRLAIEYTGLSCIAPTHMMWLFNPTLDIQHHQFVAVYVNGEFWGFKAFRDRLDQWYLTTKYDVDPDDVVILDGTPGNLSHGEPGDETHYRTMRTLIDTSDLSVEANFQQVAERMDLESYLDYAVATFFFHNTDWHSKHQQMWRYKGEPQPGTSLDGRWRWMPFDYDAAFFRGQWDASASFMNNLNNQSYFIGRLVNNPDYRRRFINRFADMNNTIFRPETSTAILEELRAPLNDTLITDHVDRWRYRSSLQNWVDHYDFLVNFLEQRPAHIRQHLRSQFNLGPDVDITLHANLDHGHIRINGMPLDGSIPGMTPDVYPWSGTYFDGTPIDLEAVPGPGYRFVGWSGDVDSTDDALQLSPFEGLELQAIFEPLPGVALEGQSLPPTAQRAIGARTARIAVLDENDEVATTISGQMEATLVSGPGTFSGTLVQPLVDGVARFNDLVFDETGRYTFQFTATDVDDSLEWIVDVADVTGIHVPQFIQGTRPNNDRVPHLFYARIEGLHPSTTYRMANRIVDDGDSATQNGAGNAFYTTDAGQLFRTTATPDFTDPETHGWITTDENGVHEGWYITEPSGNQRFEPGAVVYSRILLNDGQDGKEYHHYLTIGDSMRVLEFGNNADQATGVVGIATPGSARHVFLFDNAEGVGRPLAGTLVEDDGVTVDDRFVDFYLDEVDGIPGRWGTLLPNLLPNGLRRVQYHGDDPHLPMRVHTSPDGFWNEDVNTQNPSQGHDAIMIDLPPPGFEGVIVR